MNNFDTMAEKIRKILTEKDAAREKMLPLCRDSIRFSSTAIRSIHRHEFAEAEKLVQSARSVLTEAEKAVKDCPELGNTGAVKDAQKEMAEASITLALVTGKDIPTMEALGVDAAAFLNGMGEANGEIRRYLLDGMRKGDLSRGEELLGIMDDVYGMLVTMDFPDALTGGLRRTTDMVRGVLEKTRSDLTLAITQKTLEKRLIGLDKIQTEIPKKSEPEISVEEIEDLQKEDPGLNIFEMELYKKLEAWRNKKANEENIAPFVIAKNAWLKEIARMRPDVPEELQKIPGFGERRVTKYGKEIIAVIQKG
jgi:translin